MEQYSPEIEKLGNGGRLVSLQGDVSNKDSLRELAAKIEKEDGKLHVLVK